MHDKRSSTNSLNRANTKNILLEKYESELELRTKKQIRYIDGAFQAIGGSDSKYAIAKTICDRLNLATDTVLIYRVYSRAINRIMNIEDKLVRMILMDEVRISH